MRIVNEVDDFSKLFGKRDRFDDSFQHLTKDQYREAFWLKNKMLGEDYNYEEIKPNDFYKDLFFMPLEPTGTPSNITTKLSNIMVVYAPDENPKSRLKTWVLTESERDDIEKKFNDNRCSMIPCCTFYGRTAKKSNARYIYAITIDLDCVSVKNLENVLWQMQNDVIPTATYIVNSGTGLHLYYALNEPIEAYPRNIKPLTLLKHALTRRVWGGYTSSIQPVTFNKELQKPQDNRQYQSLFQGYRTIGSLTKLGEGYRVTAFKVGRKWDLVDLNPYLHDKEAEFSEEKCMYKSELPLKQAKFLFPDWYERRIVRKEPRKKWHLNPRVYDWWLRRISSEASYGHRYFCIGMLAVFGIKCDISKDKVMADAMSLFDHMNDIKREFPLGEDEIKKAVNGYYQPSFATFPKNSIEHLTQIFSNAIRRNGRPQETHLKIARFIRDTSNTNWQNKEGAPKKALLVKFWRKENPLGNQSECARELKISRTTVNKWWDK